ncbi:MAG TPA: 3-oxoacyl-[acyl-carrier-protein] synthase III C-terminal domain-containing protein [Candidatus Acidoferrum sp.]|jgi:3-oxoacyl-[acyl-carrier-protein] synthase-3
MAIRPTSVTLRSSGVAFGSRTVPSEKVDADFGMPAEKLRLRAGIVSVAYAEADECEVTLGARAARMALEQGNLDPGVLDWVIASSETHHAFPSLAAQLHLAVDARETCGALDVGGACLGSLHAFAVAKSFIESRQANTVLVVTADVHSRTLTPGRVAGEFGGLFGDGASAFLIQGKPPTASQNYFSLQDFFFGCASQLQQAIQVSAEPGDRLKVVFDGDALSRAATARLDQCIQELESRSGVSRSEVVAFATHQPNPRLVALLAKKCGVPLERFPLIVDRRGNLGSTTCAASLHFALRATSLGGTQSRRTIFVASLAPGLLYGGGWLTSAAGLHR